MDTCYSVKQDKMECSEHTKMESSDSDLNVRMVEQLHQFLAKSLVAYKQQFGAVIFYHKIPQRSCGVAGTKDVIL